MGALLTTLRQIFSSVFGHRDIVHLLEDDFEMDPAMKPGSGPADLHRQAREKARANARPRKPTAPRGRRQPGPPLQLNNTVAAGLARDTYGGSTSLEIPEVDAFDWSGEFSAGEEPAAPVALVLTQTAPMPAPAQRQPAPLAPEDSGRLFVFATGVVPPSQDSDALPLPTPPPLRLESPRSAGASAFGQSVRLALDVSASARASQCTLAPPAPSRFGPPPSTLWDEQEIKMELLEQLDAERDEVPDGVPRREWSRALDRLARALKDLQRELPPLPSAASRLLGVGGPSPTDEEVVDAIKGDPALAGRLIKAANSPFYMAAAPASSLQAALVRMGLQEARRVAIAAAFEETFEAGAEAELFAQLRQHALATAIAGEILARSARGVDSGEAFLAGLLHDAGELLVLRMLAESPPSKAPTSSAPGRASSGPISTQASKALAERVHQRMGALLLGEWDLDAGVAATLGWHHVPHLVEDRFAPLCHVIHVADLIAGRALLHGRSDAWRRARDLYDEHDDPTARDRAMAADGIDDLDVSDLLALVPPGFGEDRLQGVLRGVLLRLETSPG